MLLSIVERYAERLILPPACWMLLAGVGYGLVDWWTGWPLPQPEVRPEVTLYLFLPVLLFISARRLNLRDLRAVGAEAVGLATVGLAVSAALLTVGTAWLFDLNYTVAMLFAVAASATDPLAIGAVMKQFNAPRRLITLIEAESMLNDGTTIVLFSIAMAIVFGGGAFVADHPVVGFIAVMVGGAVVGTAMGLAGYLLIRLWRAMHHWFVGIVIPAITVYATFVLAEGLLHVSGVVAVMAATVTLRSMHKRREEPAEHDRDLFFEQFWAFVQALVNGILFFVLGAMIGRHDWIVAWFTIPAVIVLLLAARAAGAYGVTLLLRPVLGRPPWSWVHALNLAGLKGAVTIALLLLIPEDDPHRETFLCAAFVLVLFTLMIHSLAARYYLDLADLSETSNEPS